MKDNNLAVLKLELRKLYDRYPAEFEYTISYIERMAVHEATRAPNPAPDLEDTTAARLNWVLPPVKIVRGKAARLSEVSLAMLLAEYRCREGSREDFIDQMRACAFSNGYSWGRINVEDHLKAAEKREKGDASFASHVVALTSVFRKMNEARRQGASNRFGPP
jgi:hypothetical protein